jgi:hypothetical protein
MKNENSFEAPLILLLCITFLVAFFGPIYDYLPWKHVWIDPRISQLVFGLFYGVAIDGIIWFVYRKLRSR